MQRTGDREVLHGSNPGRVASELWRLRLPSLSDCSEDTIMFKPRPLLSGVYARGSKISHTGGKCVTCRRFHNSEIYVQLAALALEWAV